MRPPSDGSSPDGSPIARRELVLVALLTLVAAALRAWQLSRAGLGQYDEGVYAFTGWGVIDSTQPFRFYPQQEKFSPPFYFSMVALAYLLRGVSDTSAILVNVVFGTVTVPVLWFVGRRWFGPAAGAAAATFLVFGPTHLTLSRSGLTDVSFALNFLVALAALVWAMERGGVRAAILGGVATGVAWNTKYHGWFAGVIAIGSVLGMHWSHRRPDEAKSRLRVLAIAAGVAILCYLPWALYIRAQPESVGGWSRYFATFLRLDWPGNLLRHVRQQDYLETALSCASVPLALVAACVANGSTSLIRPRRLVPLALGCGGVALLAGSFGTTSLAALAAIPLLVRRGRVADWALLCWLALWVVMAPLYLPYFRLLLPFCLAAYLGAGLWLAHRIASTVEVPAPRAPERAAAPLAVAAVAVLVYIAVPYVRPAVADPWTRGDAFREAASRMAQLIPEGARVTVVGEPPLAYYLNLAGRPAFESPTPASLDTMRSTGYLVTGVYTKRAPTLRIALANRRPGLDSIATFHVEPNDLRLIDDGGATWARAFRREPSDVFDLTLCRFK